MSIEMFKRSSARDSEFKGTNADTDKYYNKHSWKSNLIVTVGIIVLIIVGFYFLSK